MSTLTIVIILLVAVVVGAVMLFNFWQSRVNRREAERLFRQETGALDEQASIARRRRSSFNQPPAEDPLLAEVELPLYANDPLENGAAEVGGIVSDRRDHGQGRGDAPFYSDDDEGGDPRPATPGYPASAAGPGRPFGAPASASAEPAEFDAVEATGFEATARPMGTPLSFGGLSAGGPDPMSSGLGDDGDEGGGNRAKLSQFADDLRRITDRMPQSPEGGEPAGAGSRQSVVPAADADARGTGADTSIGTTADGGAAGGRSGRWGIGRRRIGSGGFGSRASHGAASRGGAGTGPEVPAFDGADFDPRGDTHPGRDPEAPVGPGPGTGVPAPAYPRWPADLASGADGASGPHGAYGDRGDGNPGRDSGTARYSGVGGSSGAPGDSGAPHDSGVARDSGAAGDFGHPDGPGPSSIGAAPVPMSVLASVDGVPAPVPGTDGGRAPVADPRFPEIDLILDLLPVNPINSDRLIALASSLRHAGSKPIRIEISRGDSRFVALQSGVMVGVVRLSVLLANRQGALNAVELSDFMSAVGSLADHLGASFTPPDLNQILGRARAVDSLAAELDTQVEILVETPERLSATELAKLSRDLQLHDRGGSTFARLNDGGEVVFMMSAAHPDAIRFTLDVPRVGETNDPWRSLVNCASRCAEAIGGRVTDVEGRGLSVGMIDAVSRQLGRRHEQLARAGLEAGSTPALRVFN